MVERILKSAYFDAAATLECGQTFRFFEKDGKTTVLSSDRACCLKNTDGGVLLRTKDEDFDYFFRYFDMQRDYSPIYEFACKEGGAVRAAARAGKGIRILNQNTEETFFTFLLSQNNNIPRIRGLVERLCSALGSRFVFEGCEYFSFPSAEKMAEKNAAFYSSLGFGYRAAYVADCACRIADTDLSAFRALSTPQLREKLCTFSGVGPKVADCILLFGFHRTDVFPVDTWIEKTYRSEFGGKETDRKKIAEYFIRRFGEFGGYVQQYLFYAKREGVLD